MKPAGNRSNQANFTASQQFSQTAPRGPLLMRPLDQGSSVILHVSPTLCQFPPIICSGVVVSSPRAVVAAGGHHDPCATCSEVASEVASESARATLGPAQVVMHITPFGGHTDGPVDTSLKGGPFSQRPSAYRASPAVRAGAGSTPWKRHRFPVLTRGSSWVPCWVRPLSVSGVGHGRRMIRMGAAK